MSQMTKQDVLAKLKEEGITDLDALAEIAVKMNQEEEPQSVGDPYIVHCQYVIKGD